MIKEFFMEIALWLVDWLAGGELYDMVTKIFIVIIFVAGMIGAVVVTIMRYWA